MLRSKFRVYVPIILALLSPASGQGYQPKIEPATDAGRKAIEKFQFPKDLKVSLWAAEPDLANPVAFCFDPQGRIYVAESFRLHKGVTDNRSHRNWLDEELACRTVEDRVRMYRRRFGEKIVDWQREHERVRRLEDTDGDGVADRSVVFADGFKEIADGIGAGLLVNRGEVYFTCIPKLWILKDEDGDGVADRRRAVQDGYGVHTSLLGHDLHGLRLGPDGKLYFSIGDRGFHVSSGDRTVSYPDEGAVLRCNLDGSELEVVHRGLRNPQELAFDDFGNLFTGDNNSDGGDKARWVYVVEGGHSGWHIGYQSIAGRGPWNDEKLWHPHFPGQASYIVPPIANLANGPSGLTYDPGVGLPRRYRGRFFLCEFRGGSGNSGILALAQSPKGAGFELTDEERLLWKVLPTDVEFAPDGTLFLTDWTEGWGQPHKGRIYRLAPPKPDPRGAVSAALLASDFSKREESNLVRLIGHVDQRVRQEAQFELVRRKAGARLLKIATTRKRRMARIHAIWGIGQLGRSDAKLLARLDPLLQDPDHEVRAQVAKVYGWGRLVRGAQALVERLKDRSSRVQFFAAIALGRIGASQLEEGHPESGQPNKALDGGLATKAVAALIELLERNADRDAYLRHAAISGLAGVADSAALRRYAEHESVFVRLGLVVAMRRTKNVDVARFLDDARPEVVLEAARAIHDEPIEAAMPALAAILGRPGSDDPTLLRRVVNANLRVGTKAAAQRLVTCVDNRRLPAAARVDALRALTLWADPPGRDRVINLVATDRQARPQGDAGDRHPAPCRLVADRTRRGSDGGAAVRGTFRSAVTRG